MSITAGALELLGRIAAEAEDTGDLDAALARTQEQMTLDPLLEDANRELIRRLAAAGDRAGGAGGLEGLRRSVAPRSGDGPVGRHPGVG